MTTSDWIMVVAIVLAPFIAVFTQRSIEHWRERCNRKIWVFKTLMATRAQALSPEHIRALNMIDLEFTGKGDQAVITAWRAYNDHLSSAPQDGENLDQRLAVWESDIAKLLTDLLEKMGNRLGYSFDQVQLKRGAYSPKGPHEVEMEIQRLRRLALEWLAGDRRVTISVVPHDQEEAKRGRIYYDSMIRVLDGQQPLTIQILSPGEDVDPPERDSDSGSYQPQ